MSDVLPSTCPLCEAMCGIRVTVTEGRATEVRGDPEDPFSQGHICPKAAALVDLQHDPDRVRTPLKRTPSGWEPVGWDAALDDIADRIHALQQAHGHDAMAAYAGNPNVHNLGSMLFLPMFLRTLRTKNKFSATSLDQLPHMLAASLMFGHELLMPVPDVDRTDFMIVLGGNPLVSNGSIMTAPGIRHRLRRLRERGELVVVDPRRTETARAADEHHFIRPGTDVFFLLGLLRALLDLGPPRLLHLADQVDGVDAIETLATTVDLPEVAERTGIAVEVIRGLARSLRDTPRAVLYGRLGACAQAFGGVAAWLVNVVNAISGHLDTPGGLMVTSPAVDVLYPPGRSRKERRRFDRFRSRVRGLPELAGELPTSALAEEIDTPGDGQIRGLVVWAGNPVLSAPDGQRLRRALADLDLLVVVDLYRNESAEHADYVLPAMPPLSRDHYDLAFNALAVRNTAKLSAAVLPAEAGPRDDWRIQVDLADRLQRRRGAGMVDRARWAGLRRVGPIGLLAAGLRGGPVSLRQLRASPHGIDLGPLQSCLLERSPRRRLELAPARYVAAAAAALHEPPMAPGLSLIGRRELRSCNSWLHNSRRLTKGTQCTLRVHPDDAAEHGVVDGEVARVRSRVGTVEVLVEVSDEMMPGVVSLPHGWGHRGAGWRHAAANPGASVNDLTDGQHVDAVSGNAVLNGVPVELGPVVRPS